MASAESLLTADEFARLPAGPYLRELVRGRVITMNPPYPFHGYVCVNVASMLRQFATANALGRVFSNAAGVVTERSPDTVRGADVSFYSFQRLPPGPLPENTYLEVVPELIFEVRSTYDRWPLILRKVSEYIEAGVLVVCVVDPHTRSVVVYDADNPPRIVGKDERLTLPTVLPGFDVALSQFFE